MFYYGSVRSRVKDFRTIYHFVSEFFETEKYLAYKFLESLPTDIMDIFEN